MGHQMLSLKEFYAMCYSINLKMLQKNRTDIQSSVQENRVKFSLLY